MAANLTKISVSSVRRGGRKQKLATIVAMVVALVLQSGCGLGEAHFQAGWRGELNAASRGIIDFAKREGRLPNTFDEVVPGSEWKTSMDQKWVHYAILAPDRFMVWLRRDEIAKNFQGEPDRGLTESRPTAGDVFVEYTVDGVQRSNSWSSNFWNRI